MVILKTLGAVKFIQLLQNLYLRILYRLANLNCYDLDKRS